MDRRLSLTQLDLLREIGTIGFGRAATALADLLSAKVEITLPQASLIPLENISNLLGSSEKLFFVLDTGVSGEIQGRIFLLFSPKDAKTLSGILLAKSPEEINFNDELFRSSLQESANILSGSFISALAEFTNLNVFSSVPALAMDMVGAILDFVFIQIAQYSEEAFFIKTELKVKDLKLDGVFLFFPYSESLRRIFEAFGLE